MPVARLVEALVTDQEKIAALERDRDEWRTQHENLLAMYRAAEARAADLAVRLRDLKRAYREGDSPITAGVPQTSDLAREALSRSNAEDAPKAPEKIL